MSLHVRRLCPIDDPGPAQGGRWSERVCELIEEHGFISKVIRRSYDDLSMGLVYLSSIGSLDDGDAAAATKRRQD